jgi:hypothetical protein
MRFDELSQWPVGWRLERGEGGYYAISNNGLRLGPYPTPSSALDAAWESYED